MKISDMGKKCKSERGRGDYGKSAYILVSGGVDFGENG